MSQRLRLDPTQVESLGGGGGDAPEQALDPFGRQGTRTDKTTAKKRRAASAADNTVVPWRAPPAAHGAHGRRAPVGRPRSLKTISLPGMSRTARRTEHWRKQPNRI